LATGEEVQSRSPESNVRYAKQLEAGTRVGKRLAASGSIPRVPAKVILEALLSEDPAPRQVVGREAKVIAAMVRVLPFRALYRLTGGEAT
jgi:hypothetical protein